MLSEVDHDRIIRFCDNNDGWDSHNIEIEGEKFIYGINGILDWLVAMKIITMWDRTICRYIIDTRNYLSHQTFAPTYPSGHPYRTIKQVAFLINKMFHD